jgi:hypothetical protein
MTIRTTSLIVFSLSVTFLITIAVSLLQLEKEDTARETIEGENHYHLTLLSQLRRVSERSTLSIRAYLLSRDEKFKKDYYNAKMDFYISDKAKDKFSEVWSAFSKMEKIEESALKFIDEGQNIENATEILFSQDYYQHKYDLIYLVDKAEKSVKMARGNNLVHIDESRTFLKSLIMLLVLMIILLNVGNYLFLVRLESKILENSIF